MKDCKTKTSGLIKRNREQKCSLYNNVYIEVEAANNLQKLSKIINKKGDSKIKISINEDNINYLFELRDKRKFDLETLKNLNKEPYIKKIRV